MQNSTPSTKDRLVYGALFFTSMITILFGIIDYDKNISLTTSKYQIFFAIASLGILFLVKGKSAKKEKPDENSA